MTIDPNMAQAVFLDAAVIDAAVRLVNTAKGLALPSSPLLELCEAVETRRVANEPKCPQCGLGVTSSAPSLSPIWADTKCATCAEAALAASKAFEQIGRQVTIRINHLDEPDRSHIATKLLGKHWRDILGMRHNP